MSIIVATGIKPTKYPYSHDPNDSKYYKFVYRPDAWQASKEYLLDDIVLSTSATGYYYICTNPGISGALLPTFGTSINASTIDGTVKWKAVPYTLFLNTGDTITSSTWVGDGVTLDNAAFTSVSTWCRVTAAPALATTFTLTNTVTIHRVSGEIELFDRSIVVNIVQL